MHSDHEPPGPPGPPPFPLFSVVLVPLTMAVAGIVTGMDIMQLGGLVRSITLLGPFYTLLAIAIAVALRLRARSEAAADAPEPARPGDALARNISLVTASTLIVLWLVGAVSVLCNGALVIFLIGGPVVVGALMSIAANALLIFSPRVARAEVHAVRSRLPGYRWIVALWILAPASWILFATSGRLWVPEDWFS
ncbi:hypothetical protein [Rathayibacter rathayi]|uniref:Uncharacterized protein n=1 Tax=Rathayibacter rathayi TaxID=33887 RepID=A0ABX5AF21_RATRA|nr:hypothetical protein [Rathayibacter rathayi]AZZ48286.1 hypothetical protein C1O28_02915 [Rathayibacter rathayi]MWV74179.1 hypothetical protein [Rathayibacter rathayi NCPPB 2980 = VKM Ac-1601]PPF24024.1 hypothetical protein C5C34_06595 [Rathayibacter rathayi]PPF48982.1 hypothetical protein C5C08_08165 [Rathayibacter rathayi]PPF80079.1 hypothetical protein C5C14_07350 [Rathayibacter rathayi]